MKQGWEIKKLGEVCDIVNGSTPLRTNKDFWANGKYPWFTIDDIRQQGRIINETKQKVTHVALKKLRILPIDTILLCCTASIGEYAITKIELSTNQQFNGLVIKNKNELLPMFLLYFSSTLKDVLSDLSGKTTIDFIPISRLKDIEISLPPLPEQKRIVAILDNAFAKIEKAKANAAQNLKNAKELFESYLQGVFENKGDDLEEKTVHEFIDEGLIFKPLDGNHGEIHPLKNDYVESGIPFIMSRDMNEGKIDDENCKFISEKLANGLRTGFALNDDVLLSHKGTIGSVAILKTNYKFVVLTPQITYYRIKDKSKLLNRFIYYYFLSPKFQKTLNDIAQGGSTRAYIGITRQLTLPIVIAPFQAQQLIIQKLDALSSETKKLEAIYKQKIKDLEELKKSVLQKAFSGELEIVEAIS